MQNRLHIIKWSNLEISSNVFYFSSIKNQVDFSYKTKFIGSRPTGTTFQVNRQPPLDN